MSTLSKLRGGAFSEMSSRARLWLALVLALVGSLVSATPHFLRSAAPLVRLCASVGSAALFASVPRKGWLGAARSGYVLVLQVRCSIRRRLLALAALASPGSRGDRFLAGGRWVVRASGCWLLLVAVLGYFPLDGTGFSATTALSFVAFGGVLIALSNARAWAAEVRRRERLAGFMSMVSSWVIAGMTFGGVALARFWVTRGGGDTWTFPRFPLVEFLTICVLMAVCIEYADNRAGRPAFTLAICTPFLAGILALVLPRASEVGTDTYTVLAQVLPTILLALVLERLWSPRVAAYASPDNFQGLAANLWWVVAGLLFGEVWCLHGMTAPDGTVPSWPVEGPLISAGCLILVSLSVRLANETRRRAKNSGGEAEI